MLTILENKIHNLIRINLFDAKMTKLNRILVNQIPGNANKDLERRKGMQDFEMHKK